MITFMFRIFSSIQLVDEHTYQLSKFLTFCCPWFKSLFCISKVYIQLEPSVLILFMYLLLWHSLHKIELSRESVILTKKYFKLHTFSKRDNGLFLLFSDEEFYKLQDLFLSTECASFRQISYQKEGNRNYYSSYWHQTAEPLFLTSYLHLCTKCPHSPSVISYSIMLKRYNHFPIKDTSL